MYKRDEFSDKIGKRIKELRIKKGMTQSDLSYEIGKDRQSIQRAESGQINITTYFLYQLCNGLEISLPSFCNFDTTISE